MTSFDISEVDSQFTQFDMWSMSTFGALRGLQADLYGTNVKLLLGAKIVITVG